MCEGVGAWGDLAPAGSSLPEKAPIQVKFALCVCCCSGNCTRLSSGQGIMMHQCWFWHPKLE